MYKKRSPNYPGIPLGDAIDRVKKAYPEAQKYKSSKEVIAKLFGYNSLNGTSLTVLAAISQYGLLEGKKSEMGISVDGETIAIEPQNSKQRLETIEKCLRRPTVFEDTINHFGEDLPSDELVRPFLLRKGFSTSAVDAAIRSLRESIDFTKEERKAYNQNAEGVSVADSAPPPPAVENEESISEISDNATKKPPMTEGMQQATFPLDEGEVFFQWPVSISPDSLEDLKEWLGLLKRKIERAAKR